MRPLTKLDIASKQTTPKQAVEIQLLRHATATQNSREKQKAREWDTWPSKKTQNNQFSFSYRKGWWHSTMAKVFHKETVITYSYCLCNSNMNVLRLVCSKAGYSLSFQSAQSHSAALKHLLASDTQQTWFNPSTWQQTHSKLHLLIFKHAVLFSEANDNQVLLFPNSQ